MVRAEEVGRGKTRLETDFPPQAHKDSGSKLIQPDTLFTYQQNPFAGRYSPSLKALRDWEVYDSKVSGADTLLNTGLAQHSTILSKST